jgi:RimJ/RimL family protein N-acetyltransferase
VLAQLVGCPVLAPDAFRDQPALTGQHVRLDPLTSAVLDDYVKFLREPEGMRLTGTHAEFDVETAIVWLATRGDHHDRADWAIVRASDDVFLGEAVINDFDPANESANYRIALADPSLYGKGYGTEATRLVVDYALHAVGLHRLSLEVYDFNPRAQRTYEKCGFVLEGRLRDALLWDGVRYDSLVMSIVART